MNKDHILVQYDKDLRIHRMYPEARREVNGNVVRFIRAAPGMNFISFTLATEKQLAQAISQEVDYFVPLHQPFTWKVYEHDRLPNIDNCLLNQHFMEDSEPADVMVFDVTSNQLDIPKLPDVEIRQIKTADGLNDIVQVLDAVYGNDNSWVYKRMGLHMKIPEYLSLYGAYRQDKPVSIAWTYFPEGHFATLYGGTTLPEQRGIGLYTALLKTRLCEIRKRGYQFAVVEAGNMSKPIVEKHGFTHLTRVWDFELKQDN